MVVDVDVDLALVSEPGGQIGPGAVVGGADEQVVDGVAVQVDGQHRSAEIFAQLVALLVHAHYQRVVALAELEQVHLVIVTNTNKHSQI